MSKSLEITEEMQKAVIACLVARNAISAATSDKKQAAGVIECTSCKTGRLHYRKYLNGHIHAVCSTNDCIKFLE